MFTTKDWAERYLANGWSVIPVEARGKRPLVKWEPHQHEPPSRETVSAWCRRWPEANLGIVTGEVSGLVIVDVDPGHGGAGSLELLQRQFDPLPPTLEVVTGGGGRHLYFRHPGTRTPNRAGFAPGLDLRGDGGFVVAPPSLHASGRRYAWRPDQDPSETRPARPPDWLLDQALGAAQQPGHPAAYWRRLTHEGVPEGERNSTIASLSGHLFWRGVDRVVVTELLLCWNRQRCDPPLGDDEVIRTVESIERTHLRHQRGMTPLGGTGAGGHDSET